MGNEAAWFLYLLETRHGALYTGITTDVAKRLAVHERGAGARSLRGKGPLTLMYQAAIGSHSQALRVEARVKKLGRSEKWRLVRGELALSALLDEPEDAVTPSSS